MGVKMSKKPTSTPDKSSILKQYEDTKRKHKAQKKRFYNYLNKHVVSCTMASKALRIEQKCLTRYKRQLEKNGSLWQVFKHKCKHTNRRVWYITTNLELIPLSNQIKLF